MEERAVKEKKWEWKVERGGNNFFSVLGLYNNTFSKILVFASAHWKWRQESSKSASARWSSLQKAGQPTTTHYSFWTDAVGTGK